MHPADHSNAPPDAGERSGEAGEEAAALRERRRLRVAMAARRWFLILAAPAVLFLTLLAVLQWKWLWQLLMP